MLDLIDRAYWQCYRCLRWICDCPRHIKWFWQRGRRGYSDCDAWNIAYYLSSWMPEALRQINWHSYPGGERGCGGRTPEEWRQTIESIADGFQAHRDEDKDTTTVGWRERIAEYQRRMDKGFALFANWYGDLWD